MTTPEQTHMTNAQGHLVPIGSVRNIDILRDDLVRRLTARFHELIKGCQEFRAWADNEIDAFLQISQERYGVKLGGQCGNLNLVSYDGTMRVQRAVQKKLAFSDEIHAAKALIDECIIDWCKGARPELKTIVDEAFKVDAQGDLATDRVLGLRRLQIDDPRWLRAMEAITDSLWVDSTRQYIRFHRRKPDGTYEHIRSGV